MNDSKVLAFIFGLIPMTLIQYCYWNWLIDEIVDGNRDLEKLFLVLVILVLIYCVYERGFVFSLIVENTGFCDRLPLAVFWVLESVIGGRIFVNKLNDQLPRTSYAGSIEMITNWWSVFACGLIGCFVLCRIFLYKKWEYRFSCSMLKKQMCMNNKKMHAILYGLIPMTLIQCYYWNWMMKSLTIDRDQLNSLEELYLIPVIVILIYCVYEKYIIFSVIFVNPTFRDRIPLTIFWILECFIGTLISCEKISHYEKQFAKDWSIEFGAPICFLIGVGMILLFPIFKEILYYEKENKN